MLQKVTELSKILNSSFSAKSILNSLQDFFADYFNVKQTEIYTWDSTTSQLRDFSRNWLYIDDIFDKKTVNQYYKIYEEIQKEHSYKIVGDKIYFPFKKQEKYIGMLELVFSSNDELLQFLEVAGDVISLKVQNIILNEKMQKNINFHDSMKNIAKIIETQYELDYIIPLIGEMIDKFLANILTYIFVRENGEFKLLWPANCKDTSILDEVAKLDEQSQYKIISERKTGIFPLVNENKLLGCIAAKSMVSPLTNSDINNLEQLAKQSSATINRANVYSEILKHATLDALTGFYNRRQLEERIKQEVSNAKRQKAPLCGIMTDVDFFKGVNDTYGHAVGDLVLKTIAKVIRGQLREYDIAGRYGGEEFSILLPFTKIEEAKMVAERLRKTIETKTIDISKVNPDADVKEISVTLSLGIYEIKDTDKDEDLLIKADKALYQAKNTGRNKVVVQHE